MNTCQKKKNIQVANTQSVTPAMILRVTYKDLYFSFDYKVSQVKKVIYLKYSGLKL